MISKPLAANILTSRLMLVLGIPQSSAIRLCDGQHSPSSFALSASFTSTSFAAGVSPLTPYAQTVAR